MVWRTNLKRYASQLLTFNVSKCLTKKNKVSLTNPFLSRTTSSSSYAIHIETLAMVRKY